MKTRGQTAIEYLIALGLTTVIALTAFRTMLPNAVTQINGHVNSAITAIAGEPAKPNPGLFP